MNTLKHLAIIMDGNGRWAEKLQKSRTHGHVKGTRVAKKIITECSRLGIKHLTLYAFSSENWLRPKAEVTFLMTLLKKYLQRETKNLIHENIRFTTIGDPASLPKDVALAIAESKKATAHCTGLHLVFALSYGSKSEITQSMQKIASAVAAGQIKPTEVTAELIEKNLSTWGTPDPDLIIRTSGEKRISNFLLWQAAYSEFYFSDILWPDFTKDDLHAAINDFSKRGRRFGRVKPAHEDFAH